MTLRQRALDVIALYAEGGTVRAARGQLGVRAADFYRALREHPDLKALYHDVQLAQADMLADEALAISDAEPDPRRARVKAEVRFKLAGFYDRARFGEKVQVEHEAGPSVVAAIEAARHRALAAPGRHLEPVPNRQVIDITPTLAAPATDMQSVAAHAAAGDDDPFAA